jgi:hypothetical protein
MTRAAAGQGIRTLDDLRARCEMEGACWVWTGHFSHGLPQVTAEIGGRKISTTGRRVALRLAGKDVTGLVVHARPCCQHDACVSPWHSQASTYVKRYGALAASGVLKGNARRIDAAMRVGRARAKLTPEQVAEIRASVGQTNVQLAARYGVCRATIGDIRRGETHRRLAAASVFAFRGSIPLREAA